MATIIENNDSSDIPLGSEEIIPITLKIRDQTGDEIYYRVKNGTKLSKIFSAYAAARGVPVNVLRFFLDDLRLKDTDTPKMLEMQEDDQIDVYLEQLGGSNEVNKLSWISFLLF
jgi:hypothetical protein